MAGWWCYEVTTKTALTLSWGVRPNILLILYIWEWRLENVSTVRYYWNIAVVVGDSIYPGEGRGALVTGVFSKGGAQ